MGTLIKTLLATAVGTIIGGCAVIYMVAGPSGVIVVFACLILNHCPK